MNTKMKKVVAGVGLGTFTFGMATPAFASVNEAVAEETLYAEQTEAVVTETYMTTEMVEPAAEERSNGLSVLK